MYGIIHQNKKEYIRKNSFFFFFRDQHDTYTADNPFGHGAQLLQRQLELAGNEKWTILPPAPPPPHETKMNNVFLQFLNFGLLEQQPKCKSPVFGFYRFMATKMAAE